MRGFRFHDLRHAFRAHPGGKIGAIPCKPKVLRLFCSRLLYNVGGRNICELSVSLFPLVPHEIPPDGTSGR